MDLDEKYMRLAIDEAKKAEMIGEVPIGAIIVYDKKVIASGYNQREKNQTTLSHAELLAIKAANEYTGSWRLEDCTLDVTLEPCRMCAGAIDQSRMPRTVYGSHDATARCTGTLTNVCKKNRSHLQPNVTSAEIAAACGSMPTNF